MNAYVLIQTESHGTSLAPALGSIPGVLCAEDLSGAFDAIVLARAASARQLMDDVIAAIRRLPGVIRALPAMVPRSSSGLEGERGEPGHRARAA